MIYILCSGGLGNQMFQYAYLKHLVAQGKQTVLDVSFFKHNNVHSGFSLSKAFSINGTTQKDHFSLAWKSAYYLMSRFHLKKFCMIRMEKSNYFISEKDISNNSVLYGFWQGESFFSDVSEQVKKDFTFKDISNRSKELGLEISNCNSIAIHVRRGDYLNNTKYINLTSTNYYYNSINIAKNRLNNIRFFVFSDDIQWCKKSGLFDNNAVYVDFNSNDRAYEDMYLMSLAKGIIIANSSFSWWAGYLGSHQFVIRPNRYLNNWSEDDDKRLFPKSWICCGVDTKE